MVYLRKHNLLLLYERAPTFMRCPTCHGTDFRSLQLIYESGRSTTIGISSGDSADGRSRGDIFLSESMTDLARKAAPPSKIPEWLNLLWVLPAAIFGILIVFSPWFLIGTVLFGSLIFLTATTDKERAAYARRYNVWLSQNMCLHCGAICQPREQLLQPRQPMPARVISSKISR